MHIFLCTVSAQTLLMTPSSRRRNRARSSSHLRTNRTGKYRGVAHGAVLGLCAEGESSRQSASTASRKQGPEKSLVKYVDTPTQCGILYGILRDNYIGRNTFISPFSPPVLSVKAQWSRALKACDGQCFPKPTGRTSTRVKNYRKRELTAPLTFGVCQYDMPRCSIGIRIELQR